MIAEIKDYCRRTNQKVPETIGEIATVVYQSLALCYAETVKEIEKLSDKKFSTIHIVGGGSNASYLNELTAQYSKCRIITGPGEATEIGNLAAQLLKAQEFNSLAEIRKSIYNSFEIREIVDKEASLK